MNDYNFLLVIASVLLVGAMSPGPTFMVIARNTLTQSKAHGFVTAIGTALGVALFAVLASLGVTTLLDKVPSAFLAFKILGGGYLLYLAYRIWCSASKPLQTDQENNQSSMSYFNSFLTGLVIQISNPKTALVIAGIFAAFVPTNPPDNTIWLVSAIAFLIDFSWYATVVIILSTNTSRRAYQNAKTGFDRAASIFLGAVGVKLIAS